MVGCAMGSPVSPIVVNLCMEEIEELAHNQSFAIIKRHILTNFYKLLNSIDPHVKFTMEQEHDDKLSFLDTIVTRNSVNGFLLIDVYRKPTNRTDT